MSNSITTLANLLHKFNSQTIQRSLDYISHIDPDSLDRTETADSIVLKADVEGSEDNIYRTAVTFNKQNKRITDSRCSCPVGSFCKHGGALARLLWDRERHALTASQMHSLNQAKTIGQSGLLENLLQSMVNNANLAPNQQKSMDELLIEVQQQKAERLATPLADPVFNKQTYDEAHRWLKNLQDSLEKNAKTVAKAHNSQNASPFIYLIEQAFDQLRLHLVKVRRVKSGDIRQAKAYSHFHSIMHGGITLPMADKVLFNKIYNHSEGQDKTAYYTAYLHANELPLNLLKELLLNNILFSKPLWEKGWEQEQTHPLTWTDELLTLNIEWQNSQQNSEKLNFYLSNERSEIFKLEQKGNHQLLFTQPLSYLDKNNRQIGQVTTATLGEIPNNLLYRLMTMPPIPSDLVTEVDEIFSKSPTTQKLPKPKAVQNIENLYGTPQPIVHFSTADDINVPWQYRSELRNDTWIQKKLVLAELSFAYEGGETVANTDEFFIGKKDGNKVRQYQDKDFEKQAIKQFRQLFSSFNWLKNGTINSKFKAVIEISELLSALLPIDKIADIGWQVEHLPDSPVNVQATQNMEIHLAEIDDNADGEQQDNQWFEVGATVSDSEGHRYDLLSIVAHLLEQFPYLLNKNIEQLLDKNHLFAVEVGGGRQALAIAFKDILPILQNLIHLLSQDDRKLDRYDVAQLFDLEHALGMAWQTSDKLKTFAEKLKAGYQSSLPTPKGFVGELRPYQQQGLAWLQFLVATEHGGILADDMGLGKTAQTLAHVLMEKQAGQLKGKPVLIVAPTSLMHNWQKEAEKFTPTLKVLLLHGANRHEDFDKISKSDIVLTTYPLVVRDEERLKAQQFHQIILDEAQNIKNPRSKSAHTLRMLNATHRLCLTGTPMENHLGELWSLFYFLMPGFLGSQEVFNKQYRHPIEKKGDSQKRERLVNRTKPFILRRLKTDVAKELPPKTTIEVNIDMNDEQSKLYEAVRATMQSTIKQIIAEQGFKRSQIQILDALLKLRQVCCHPSLLNLDTLPHAKEANAKKSSKTKALQSAKLDYLIETVSDMVSEGRKILIFSQFTSMLALIEEQLIQQNIAFSKLTGQTKKRSEAIEAFQSGQVPVFLISLKAGGVGLNLTVADTVIHYDPWWNPATEDQASDRAWRIGQDKPVFVYKLITNQSIEEKILAMQKNKALLAKSILSTDHEGEVKLSEEALLGLFEKIE